MLGMVNLTINPNKPHHIGVIYLSRFCCWAVWFETESLYVALADPSTHFQNND